MKLTHKRLKEVFSYDPETGLFTRILKTGNSARLGTSGSKNGRGYSILTIDGRKHSAHRAAFLYMNGEFPPHDVDHINNIKTDNRWKNLRLATSSQNSANSKIRITNKSGFKGVGWFEKGKCWRARIQSKNECVFLGYFTTKAKAHEAYISAAIKLHGEFARLS